MKINIGKRFGLRGGAFQYILEYMASFEGKVEELLTRGVAEIIDREHLTKRLQGKEKLRVKLGIDPTSADIHLGNEVILMKLRDFQELGHKVVLIFGDFTAEIGDTSDKESERPMLSADEVARNMKTYLEQVKKILDIRKTTIYYNSRWLKKLKYREVAAQANIFSLSDFISRTNMRTRLEKGSRISLREVLYPIMQGYDSVQVRADVEVGGTDQRFNMLAGRTLQQTYKQNPQDIIMMNLILGTNGEKMSKSGGNAINITETPENMFGKVMSISDELITPYFIHCTRVPMNGVELYARQLAQNEAHPRDVKMLLAFEITKIFYGAEYAEAARAHFQTVFQEKKIPKDIKEIKMPEGNIIDILVAVGFAESKSKARQVIAEGGVRVNGSAVDIGDVIKKGSIIQKGRRHFVKIV